MPVGHQRINPKRPDPNPNITFIRALEGLPDSDRALEILEALAAQFRPIMKNWGFGVNSLVEHEWNPVFAGRNWNAGEVVEIVLRRRDGSFAPYQFLLYVMCHELAHIREMNHSWTFKKVNQQIRSALASIRAKGYFGDGFFSSGRSLTGYAHAEDPLGTADEPHYTCGGANKKRGRFVRRRNPQAGPSKPKGSAAKLGTTGRQTAIAPKAGGRVNRKGAFEGEGNVLSPDPEMSSKGRRSQAKGAVLARAAAAEARLAAEQRAKAAETRVKARSSSPADEKKPKLELDWDEEGGFDGWESNEEDKPEIKLEQEEKDWLKEEMREWREEAGLGVGGSGGKEKGKKRQASSPPAASPSSARRKSNSATSPSRAPSAMSPSDSQPKKRRGAPVTAAADGPSPLDGLDLTPEERAWLDADLSIGGRVKDESDDEIEVVTAGGGEEARVAYMAMPVSMRGTGKTGKRRASESSVSPDDDLPGPSAILQKSPPRISSTSTAKKRPMVASLGKKRAVSLDLSDSDDSDTVIEPSILKLAPSSPSPQKRSPMKSFSSGTAADKLAKKPRLPTASTSTALGTQRPPVVPPPSSDEDDDDSPPPPPPMRRKDQVKAVIAASPPPAPPTKKPRKERSDKGSKRGESNKKKKKSDRGKQSEVKEKKAVTEKKEKARKEKEPVTAVARVKAEMAKKRKASDRELLDEFEEDERKEKEEADAKAGKGKGKAPARDGVGDAKKAGEDAGKEKKDKKQKSAETEEGKGSTKKAEVVGLTLSAVACSSSGSKAVKSSTSAASARAASKNKASLLNPPKKAKKTSGYQPLVPPIPAPVPSISFDFDQDDYDSDVSIFDPPALSRPNFLDVPPSERETFLHTLAGQKAHNARVSEKRKRKQEEHERKAEESRKAIEASAKSAQREAAVRGETVDSPRGKLGGWEKNVFSEGVTEKQPEMPLQDDAAVLILQQSSSNLASTGRPLTQSQHPLTLPVRTCLA
ncbi:hypothetical protein JCM11641_001320 [Rhodosporidiobolus odoratus]